eukprot:gene3678-4233_t
MAVHIGGKAPLDFYTKTIVQDKKKMFMVLPEERRKYFVERSQELGFNNVDYSNWDLYLMADNDGTWNYGDQEFAVAMIPFSWALGDRNKSVIETYKPIKKQFRNDTNLVQSITYKDIDDEEDANIVYINTRLKHATGREMTTSNAKMFLSTFLPLLVVSKAVIPSRFPVSLVHLIIPYIAVEVNSYAKDKEQNEFSMLLHFCFGVTNWAGRAKIRSSFSYQIVCDERIFHIFLNSQLT